MNMLSFYGGPAGKDFTIAKIFPNKAAMDADIALGHDSPIYTGDYVLISYGDPNQPKFEENLAADGDTSYNATLWKKEWNDGYSYREIVSIASSYPKFGAGNIESSLKFGEAPQLTIDSSSLDIFSLDGLLKASLTMSLLNLVFTYSFRYVMIKIFILLTPFAILSLILENTSWFFKAWIRNLFSLLFIQIIVAIVLLILFSIDYSSNNLMTKFIYVGAIYALIQANSFVRDFIGGVSTTFTQNVENLFKK